MIACRVENTVEAESQVMLGKIVPYFPLTVKELVAKALKERAAPPALGSLGVC